MAHRDVIALLSNSEPMEIGIHQRFRKFAANMFHFSIQMYKYVVQYKNTIVLSKAWQHTIIQCTKVSGVAVVYIYIYIYNTVMLQYLEENSIDAVHLK